MTRRLWCASAVAALLTLSLLSSTPAASVDAADAQSFPVMQPDDATFRKWMRSYDSAPTIAAPLEAQLAGAPGGSVDLLSHLDYVPSERSQGSCGNCWAWAGTGCMEIALDTQTGILDRLSVQYINSCQYPITGNPCCDGGWLSYDFVRFYEATGICIPWSNTSAQWQDRDAGCDVVCGSIATEPYYPIGDIAAVTVPTHASEGVPGDEAAIANIKSALDSGKAVWFAFFVPTASAWSQFTSFWLHSGEEVACDLGAICRGTSRWGGHAVLCVGYDDTDPDNSYWVMLNSWGTANGVRPNGLFRVDMDMDYDTTCVVNAFYWQTLDISFGVALPTPVVQTNAATDVEETSARLDGTLVDDSGYDRDCRFALGTSSSGSYEYTTEWQPEMGSGDTFLADVADLPPGTVCYFVAQSRNAGAADSGNEEFFLTKPLPPASFSAVATGQSSAALTWTAGAGAERTIVRGKKGSPPSGPEDGYPVYEGPGAACGDVGLDPASIYWYRAWSVADEPGLDSAWSDTSAQDSTTTIGSGVWMEGDANLDAQVNIVDAMFIAQFTVGLRSLDATQLLCTDTTDDGQTNIVDSMHVAQFTVDPDTTVGILFKLLWSSPEDDALLDPLDT
ncbi:MAG: hypothetical protein M0R22_02885 [Dehalococcoidia bacterium]|nr:hypothetical protein [Dehalococcoidia bacterium]